MSDGSENAGVNYNYMYGEVVKQYLTNIDDWIEFPSTTERAISYTNAKVRQRQLEESSSQSLLSTTKTIQQTTATKKTTLINTL